MTRIPEVEMTWEQWTEKQVDVDRVKKVWDEVTRYVTFEEALYLIEEGVISSDHYLEVLADAGVEYEIR